MTFQVSHSPFRRFIFAAFAVFCLSNIAIAGPILYIDPAEGWESLARGQWEQRVDQRQLRAMRHAWTSAAQGDFAMATRRLNVPNAWQGPVYLSFYCSDDTEAPAGHRLRGHRFKQVLVNDRVVWESDVLDPVAKGTPERVRVPVPTEAGEEIRLALLVYDRAGTENAEGAPEPFMTHVYWGDLALEDGAAQAEPGERPIVATVLERHRERWPLPPFGTGWKDGATHLNLLTNGALPASGFPVRAGIPFPSGKVEDVRDVRLQTANERAIFSDKTELSRWPDGSLRWVQFDFVAKPSWATITLAFKRDWAEPSNRLDTDASENNMTIKSDKSTYIFRDGESLVEMSGDMDARIRGMLKVRDTAYPAIVTQVRVVQSGAETAEVALDGYFDLEGEQKPALAARIRVRTGQPDVDVWWRIVNDTASPIPVSGMALSIESTRTFDTLRFPGQSEAPDGPLDYRVSGPREATLNGAPVALEQPAFVTWGNLTVVPHHFELRHPSALTARPGELSVDFLSGGNTPVVLTPGEASSHTVWLALNQESPELLARHVAQSPVLSAPDYYCATGVLGPAAPWPFPNAPADENTLWGDSPVATGARDYPDVPYLNRPDEWCNNYYARDLGFWSAFVVTGNAEWYWRAMDTGNHLLDVAVIHSDVPGQAWRGGLHGPGKNHVAGPWPPTFRLAGLELQQKFTGEPDALESVLAAADFVARTTPGLDYTGPGSIRHLAGPLDSLCTGYWETGEVGFLDAGTKYVSEARSRMDMRRGVWNDTHGDVINRGNIPWMAGQMGRALYWWYRLTGDVEAAQILVALADSVLAENANWDAPGKISAFSYHPKYANAAAYYPIVLPLLFAAHELSGEERFKDAGIAAWKIWATSDAYPKDNLSIDQAANTLWMLPWLAYYGEEFALLAFPE